MGIFHFVNWLRGKSCYNVCRIILVLRSRQRMRCTSMLQFHEMPLLLLIYIKTGGPSWDHNPILPDMYTIRELVLQKAYSLHHGCVGHNIQLISCSLWPAGLLVGHWSWAVWPDTGFRAHPLPLATSQACCCPPHVPPSDPSPPLPLPPDLLLLSPLESLSLPDMLQQWPWWPTLCPELDSTYKEPHSLNLVWVPGWAWHLWSTWMRLAKCRQGKLPAWGHSAGQW